MKNKRIMMWVRGLASYENGLVDFKKYIQTNDTTRDSRMVKLYSYLLSEVKKNPDPDPDKIEAYKAVFGKRSSFDQRKMRDLVSGLTRHMEDFQIISNFQEDESLKQRIMADLLRKNRNEKQFFKIAEDLKQGTDKDEAKHYYFRSEINHDLYFYQSETNHDAQFGDTLNEHIQDLNTFHAIRYLRATSELLMKNIYRGMVTDANTLRKINAYLEFMDEPKSEVVKMLVLALKLYLRPSYEAYCFYKEKLLNKLDDLHSEKKPLFLFLINALAIIPFKGEFNREYFHLYKIAIDKNLLVENGALPSRSFNNIILIAISLKKYEWAQKFTHSHIEYLEVSDEIKEHICRLTDCYLSFGRGQYDEALRNIDLVKNIDFSYTVRKYVLSIKCEYERDNFGSMLGIKERESGFRRLLTRITSENQVSRSYQQKHLNFLNMLKKIASCHQGKYSPVYLEGLLEEQTAQLVETHWLKEKLGELKKKYGTKTQV